MKTVIWVEKGNAMNNALAAAGFVVFHEYIDGTPVHVLHCLDGHDPTDEDQASAQAVINAYDPLVPLRSERKQTLADDCRQAIEMGIDCDAIGSMLHYPTKMLDQQNLAGLAAASIVQGAAGEPYLFPARDAQGQWIRSPHAAAQIQQVGIRVKDHVVACLQQLDFLRGQVDAAQDVDGIQAVAWLNP